jgi:NitT/TauT family transport system substrate-binding protein
MRITAQDQQEDGRAGLGTVGQQVVGQRDIRAHGGVDAGQQQPEQQQEAGLLLLASVAIAQLLNCERTIPMTPLRFAAVSRNYFNLPVWIGVDQGLFRQEGIDLSVELHEGVDEVTDRLADGTVQLALGITEHVVLDSESGGHSVIIGGNVNRLPFSLIAAKGVSSFEDMRGKVVGVSSLEAGSSSLVMRLFEAHGLRHPEDYTIKAVGPILARWDKLQSGEIQAGLQGAPLNYIAADAGFSTLVEPRLMFPDFQFTSLHVLAPWAAANRPLVVRFMRAFIRAHEWFYNNRAGAAAIAMRETGVARPYADRAWDEYVAAEIFPRDGDASDAAVQALIEISGRIRALSHRTKTRAADYIDRSYLHEARASLRQAA